MTEVTADVCPACQGKGVDYPFERGNLAVYCFCAAGKAAFERDFGPNDLERMAAKKFFSKELAK